MPPHDLPLSLVEALRRSREWGFLGEGPLETHIAHAQGFAEAAEALAGPRLTHGAGSPDPGKDTWMDLGSGGGIPGLVLAFRWPQRRALLLDGNERRARFLTEVVESLGWGDRVRIVTARAEVAGRMDDLRAAFSLVVARSFGAPPVTAECAAPFLRQGGLLIVSEPPESAVEVGSDTGRWPLEGLRTLGMEPLERWRREFGYQVILQAEECPDRFPRRVGVPTKRPLYRIQPGPARPESP